MRETIVILTAGKLLGGGRIEALLIRRRVANQFLRCGAPRELKTYFNMQEEEAARCLQIRH